MCAQFESWKHPFTIMLTVPMAILGGLLGILSRWSSLNVYSQIALNYSHRTLCKKWNLNCRVCQSTKKRRKEY